MNSVYRIEDPWCRHLPLLHRLLADPPSDEPFPRVAESLPLQEACAVWETLHYLLRALLGWDDPGLGLSWWYAHGKPVEDSPLLAAVARWWSGENLLDFYAAWAWNESLARFRRGEGVRADAAPADWYADERWWEAFRRRPRPAGSNPYYGGSNPLHLGHSDGFGWEEVEPDRARLHFDVPTRQAVLIPNHFGSWREDLQRAEKLLPPIGERSWRVEVFDRQTGYLGLFRRSRVTSRWFQGKHSIHIRGQRSAAREIAQ